MILKTCRMAATLKRCGNAASWDSCIMYSLGMRVHGIIILHTGVDQAQRGTWHRRLDVVLWPGPLFLRAIPEVKDIGPTYDNKRLHQPTAAVSRSLRDRTQSPHYLVSGQSWSPADQSARHPSMCPPHRPTEGS